MAHPAPSTRKIRIFRYDPASGGEGRWDEFALEIPDETTTTLLDVLLRLQQEQDATLAFRYACRVNMCGSCGMVVNGKERLACKTNVSHVPKGQEITLRPLNHFPVIKDLAVDMEPFFERYAWTLPFYEPKEEYAEPARIRPDSDERREIGDATECIACGCCVSSCTMVHDHEGYAGPAALNRAFTLLADSRDALFEPRLERALESCWFCRTELNCTEVCPKGISSTRAIKYIQRLALRRSPARARPEPVAAIAAPAVAPVPTSARAAAAVAPAMKAALPAAARTTATDRRTFLRRVGVGLIGGGAVAGLATLATAAVIGPALEAPRKRWVPVAPLGAIRAGGVTTLTMTYERESGIYRHEVTAPVLVSRTGEELVCFKASCPHLGCLVRWDAGSERFRCACHGGVFERDGTVVAGPPPRPLDRYAFRIDSGHLLVEVG